MCYIYKNLYNFIHMVSLSQTIKLAKNLALEYFKADESGDLEKQIKCLEELKKILPILKDKKTLALVKRFARFKRDEKIYSEYLKFIKELEETLYPKRFLFGKKDYVEELRKKLKEKETSILNLKKILIKSMSIISAIVILFSSLPTPSSYASNIYTFGQRAEKAYNELDKEINKIKKEETEKMLIRLAISYVQKEKNAKVEEVEEFLKVVVSRKGIKNISEHDLSIIASFAIEKEKELEEKVLNKERNITNILQNAKYEEDTTEKMAIRNVTIRGQLSAFIFRIYSLKIDHLRNLLKNSELTNKEKDKFVNLIIKIFSNLKREGIVENIEDFKYELENIVAGALSVIDGQNSFKKFKDFYGSIFNNNEEDIKFFIQTCGKLNGNKLNNIPLQLVQR